MMKSWCTRMLLEMPWEEPDLWLYFGNKKRCLSLSMCMLGGRGGGCVRMCVRVHVCVCVCVCVLMHAYVCVCVLHLLNLCSSMYCRIMFRCAHKLTWLCFSRSLLIGHFCENNAFYILLSWLPTFFHENFPSARVSTLRLFHAFC